MKTTFREVLKDLTKEKNTTISKIAEDIGISQSWLSGMLIYKPEKMPMKRIQEILESLGENLTLADGTNPDFSEYNTTVREFRVILKSMGRQLIIQLENGDKYEL